MELLDEFSAMTQMETRLSMDGDIFHDTSSLQPTIKRVVQEGLTNAMKHGNARTCLVTIYVREKAIRLTIKTMALDRRISFRTSV